MLLQPITKPTLIRIAAVSVLLATIASPITWFVSRERTEDSVVALALEESKRMLNLHDELTLIGPDAASQSTLAAQSITGGLFDISEIYDAQGRRLAEASTADGKAIQEELPSYLPPRNRSVAYESLKLRDGRWALRVFIPLHARGVETTPLSGHLVGLRIIPSWQKKQIPLNSMTVALVACLASLLCGAALYPVVINLYADNRRKSKEVMDSNISMMEALGRAIAKRDSDTGTHNYRVAWIASQLGERLGVSGRNMQALLAGSFLHDVGKIGIPDAILLKPGKLTPEEFEIMRTHVQLGEEIVKGMGWLDGAKAVVAGHHEKWNGTGYPRKLAGKEIPLSARIFAVADVFDALCSKRPYKNSMTFDEAMTIIRRDAGTHFDPVIVRAFDEIAPAIHETIFDICEEDARALLEEQVRTYFGV